MTTLKSIFKKPVDRPIEGVIKADDEASLRLEIEEYVLTNEIEQRIESFLDAYNNIKGVNGAWVSGFFGSGKSHLLKILSMLLENRTVDGEKSFDLFLPKCKNNEILLGDLRRAVSIPSKSILFNIDQKADVISKSQIDALLSVFVKVFDEMCGYYGKQGHIAQFERDLDSRDQYLEFKAVYQQMAGKIWEKGREQALLESQNIAKAYAIVTASTETQALGILDKYRSQYRVSIEDFAGYVKEYLDRQSSDFRLNFFVDEVGQYIAGNQKLITNLQTIAESLATKCSGRSWIVVTSQEDLDSIIGDRDAQQTNDFSKIKARFACETGNSPGRMKLTSKNVDEVIQKRLLEKTEDGVEFLSKIFHQQENNFRTLFDFHDGSRGYENFKDREHLIYCYPFIPYQFALFQSAIQNLSQHNAFEGKHSSVGERSMLGVFQQVVIQLRNQEVGQLATFDLMFEGIRSALKSNFQRAILQSEKHLNNELAIRLLKNLFLVKYVKEFKSTLRNLCVLMLDGFDQDLPLLRKKVEEALNLLEQQTYIQRNGDFYEYLTDDEKDVEVEIKNTEIDASEIATELEKIIFDHIIKNRKIRFIENNQDYPFNRQIDDQILSKKNELTIHVITPFHDKFSDEDTLVRNSWGRDELLVVMPPDDRIVSDLLMYKRAEKFVRQNNTIAQPEAIKRILTDKSFQNRERYMLIQQQINNLLSKAKFFVAGTLIEISGEDPQNRITHGFHELIMRTYSNISMLRGITFKEDDITKYLKHSQEGLFGNDVTTLTEPEQEVLAYIQTNNRGGIRTTLKNLLEKFEAKPYGWYYAAILCNLAKLCARGKIEVRIDSNLLEEDELDRAFRNTHGHGNVVLEPQVDFTASQIRMLKEFFEDFFDTPPTATEAKSIGKETAAAMLDKVQQLTLLLSQTSQYPFLSILEAPIEKLNGMTGMSYVWYLTDFMLNKDVLLDMKETTIDPILKFMSGPLKEIFDVARKFVESQEPNFVYLEGPESAQLIEITTDPGCYRGNKMQQAKALVDQLQRQVKKHLDSEVTKAKEGIFALKNKMCSMPEFVSVNPENQEVIIKPFDTLVQSVERQKLIPVVRDTLRRFEESNYQRLLSQMVSWSKMGIQGLEGKDEQSPNIQSDPVDEPGLPEQGIEYIQSTSVHVSFEKAWLANESDVEGYIESMRKALLSEIRKGKRIQI